jgi:hypothetical protein
MKDAIAQLAPALPNVTPEAIKKWRQRGAVPPKHRQPLIELAQKRGVALRHRDFDFTPTAGARKQRVN